MSGVSFALGVVAVDPVPSGGTTGQVLAKKSNTDYDTEWTTGGGGGSGTVTSVAMTVPTGLTVTGSPITTSGTLDVSLTTGYSIPTTASQTNWDTAYSLASTAVQPAAIANMLETSDIGVSVQGYNANYVVDASYVHTDNNYTTTEKSKLAGIAAGAEVNVNADWNAVSGDAQILNKPTLGTAAAQDTSYFATAAQGTKADSALQPAAIGVSVQAYDADLTAWAGVSTSAKQDTLVSGTNIKTVNSTSLLGSGDVTVQSTLVSGTNIKSVNSTSLLGSGDLALFAGGLIQVKVVATLPGTPNANTLYIVTT